MSRTTKTQPTAAKPVVPAKNAALSWKDRLHPEEYEQLRATFSLFDSDNSGTIDPEEINKIMDELGEGRKGTLIYNIIEGLKVKNKPITFDEFVELVTPRVGDIKTKEGLRTVFSHLDTDNDDYINYDELKHLAKLSGDMINDD
jgi:Ca2+-binding EF-hand superfamily protein